MFQDAINQCFAYVTSILRTFQSLVDGGKEVTAPQWHRELMKAWSSKVESYFLLASSRGSLDAVEYFIASGQKPNLRYIDHPYSTYILVFRLLFYRPTPKIKL